MQYFQGNVTHYSASIGLEKVIVSGILFYLWFYKDYKIRKNTIFDKVKGAGAPKWCAVSFPCRKFEGC